MSDRKIRILLIDDETEYSEILKDRLEYEGYEAIIAGDGTNGFRKLHEEKFDVVLLDLMMPGMDGFDFVNALKEENGKIADVPVIIVTAYGEQLSADRQKVLKGKKFLVKPFEVEDLLRTISEVTPAHKAK